MHKTIQQSQTVGQAPKRIDAWRREPERGQREQLRAFRRAQGGPGIDLVGATWRVRGAK